VSQLKGRQLGGEFSGSKIRRLKKAMRDRGFDEAYPIDIVEIDGHKIIIDGHHRARAAGAAGIKEVPVRINPVTPEQGTTLLAQAAEAAENLGLPF
jgi:ParB-like chromosome segregation protein Spo0J